MTLDCTYTKRLLKSPAREVCCLRTFADLLAIAMPSRWRLQFTARSLPCTWYVSLLSQALHCCLVFLSPVPLMQLQGDALAAPLHWYYSWDIAQQHLLTYYNGRIHAYSPTHPAARHPDSGKYFARVKPTEHPVPGVFRSCRDRPNVFGGCHTLPPALKKCKALMPALITMDRLGGNSVNGSNIAKAIDKS